MECKICGKTGEETELLRGIFEDKIEPVCIQCSKVEGIPIVRKPNLEILDEKKEHLSVRERMERMANPQKPVPREQFIAHKNLAKLNFPNKREDHPDLIENYDWVLKTARRRKKLSQTHVAEQLIIPLQVIMDLESGKIAKNFEDYADRLENFLGVRIRKRVPEPFHFQRKPQNEEEKMMVLESVRENMQGKNEREKTDEEIDFKDKEKLKKWTLRDLINLKRKKDKEKEEFMGDELQIEE